ncbi:MAG: hypothetical protein SGILL_001397, partial [Bacillariaceae sp.]
MIKRLSRLLSLALPVTAIIVAVGEALSSATTTKAATSPAPAPVSLIKHEDVATIAGGGVAIIPDFLSPSLVKRMRKDARQLFQDGFFVPDGLTNTALTKTQQGFSSGEDRQTFRGGDGWNDPTAGNVETRKEFASIMADLRSYLATRLDRPTLQADGVRKHEMTYNWYEKGASLGRHLDEHHEETKGSKGWLLPTRRSVTWLVYLNDDWGEDEGGSLHTFPRERLARVPVGAHQGNLQVGWIDHVHPVFLDAWRDSGQCALYILEPTDEDENTRQSPKQTYISAADFDVPRQPIQFEKFLLAKYTRGGRFEQISTARLDPRFAAVNNKDSVADATAAQAKATIPNKSDSKDQHYQDILPTGGTLVLFDSVSLPHSVNPVTGNRQRIAATGWFHEDNQALPT